MELIIAFIEHYVKDKVNDIFFMLQFIFPFPYFGVLGILLGIIGLLDKK